MKTLNLYYVFDNVGGEQIAGPIPAANDFIAALGFRDSFIKQKKSPYSFKALSLVQFGTVNVDENGCFSIPEQSKKEIKGTDIMAFIAEKCAEYGIEDDILEDNEEKSK